MGTAILYGTDMANAPPLGPPRKVKKGQVLSVKQWADAALWQMRHGSAAVSVDAVARVLGVTKGSFYWHFADRDALLAAALQRWEELATDGVIALLSRYPSPRERLAKLLELAIVDEDLHLAIEVAIASSPEPVVRKAAARVSNRRLAYVQLQYRQLGQTPAQARTSGLATYAAYVGAVQLMSVTPEVLPSPAAQRAYVAHVVQALVR